MASKFAEAFSRTWPDALIPSSPASAPDRLNVTCPLTPVSTSVAVATYTTVLALAFSSTLALLPLVITGSSLAPATVTVVSRLAVLPPSPSVSTKRTVLAPVVGASLSVSWYVILRASAVNAVADALASSVITRLAPPLPPVKAPNTNPPNVTFVPTTPICPTPAPSLRTASTSSALSLPATNATVNTPPLKSALSTSVTRALAPCSITTAPSPSV